VTFTVEEVVERLADAGVRLDRGLTEADVKRIEQKFGFAFGPEHRSLLRTALPLGDTWLNWRHATPVKIRERLRAPIDAIVAAVHEHDFWPASWGPRPDDAAAETAARANLAALPVLVPLYGHSYLPAGPIPAGSPVFSVQPSPGRPAGVSLHGTDLLNFVDVEFGSAEPPADPAAGAPHLAFWSDLALGADSARL
jgi:hypothetical protein